LREPNAKWNKVLLQVNVLSKEFERQERQRYRKKYGRKYCQYEL
jgi:hypothetical protein